MSGLEKYGRIGLLILCLILLGSPQSIRALDYVEASQGLSEVQWEGGRTEIEMADLNLDGKLDLITIGDHGSPYINTQEHGVAVYFGDGMGRWSLYMNGDFGYGGITVGDVNNDGLPDIGYGMHHNYSTSDFGDQLLEVALGDGTGRNWTPWDDNLATQGEDYGMFATDFGDVDNDGDLDIAATSFGYGNPLEIYLNDGDGTWTHSAAVSSGNCGMHIVFGDINRDGNLDLATSYQNGAVFFGNGDGTFYNADYNLPGGGTYGRNGISLGDVDGDGGMDVAYILSGGIQVWSYNESSSNWTNYCGTLPASGSWGMTQLCDMNSDGFCDVAAAGAGNVSVWTGNGAGAWTQAASYVIQNDPTGPFEAFRTGGDVDHNGKPDIVHITDEGGSFNSYNHLRFYREISIPTFLSLLPAYPRGGEVFKGGSTRFTNWISAVPGGAVSHVTIELSSNGPTGPWVPLAQALPDNGRLQFTVPTGINSNNCRFRYTLSTTSDTVITITPGSFTIMGSAPNLVISVEPLAPPIIIPANGGSFGFMLGLTNNQGIPLSCDVWTDVRLPSGNLYGPVINASITAPLGAVSRQRTQQVPASAPAGNFYYRGFAGSYPNVIWSSDSLLFTKSSVSAGNGATTSWWSDFSGFDDIAEVTPLQHLEFKLVKASPNPFNPTTTISYELPTARLVNLTVYDVNGRKVAELVKGMRDAGSHTVTFDGSGLASGVYIYHLTAGTNIASGKMVLMK
ncbi:MAG: T9SS type A sorting domain-containing protein [bacterium]|nr:T9SS type A sorting domain-containing protein [bacterium]